MLLLQFQAGNDRYGLDVAEVIEVVPRVTCREIPHTCPAVAGLINYRGTPVPVVDLTALITGAPSRPFFSTRIILTDYPDREGGHRVLGLMAERVTETVSCGEGDFRPLGVNPAEAPYLGDICLHPDGTILRVRVEELLTPELRAALFTAAEDG